MAITHLDLRVVQSESIHKQAHARTGFIDLLGAQAHYLIVSPFLHVGLLNVCVRVCACSQGRKRESERICLHDEKILIYLNEPVWIMIGVFSHFSFFT